MARFLSTRYVGPAVQGQVSVHRISDRGVKANIYHIRLNGLVLWTPIDWIKVDLGRRGLLGSIMAGGWSFGSCIPSQFTTAKCPEGHLRGRDGGSGCSSGEGKLESRLDVSYGSIEKCR